MIYDERRALSKQMRIGSTLFFFLNNTGLEVVDHGVDAIRLKMLYCWILVQGRLK